MPFLFENTSLSGVLLVTPRVLADGRGSFLEAYKASDFEANGIAGPFPQDNHSISGQGVLRGLHYQNPPAAQGKLVRCVVGAVWDVAVDIRSRSKTFGCWVGKELTAENRRMLYIPAGFAHGFLTLSPTAEVIYKVTAEYSPEAEAGIAWDDPALDIQWPTDKPPLLSDKDKNYPVLAEADNRFRYGP